MRQTKLKELLAERHTNISRLAEMTGVTRATLYRKIEGVYDFSFTEVYKICTILGITNPFEIFIPKEA